MHLPAAQDLLTIFRWAFAGLRGFEPMPQQTHIKPGLVDRQTTLAGGGSCGIVSTNFIEIRVGLDTPRWSSKQSAQFRDVFLQEVLLFHLLARRKMTLDDEKHKALKAVLGKLEKTAEVSGSSVRT
ncbi:hypothetical protein B0H10DRAFT_2148023 [Mycena sp. CBHHK59/15]|nr:hypothetical protein B0H10DRAFT_2148023 [Mycena sp. CBHHK59/15]